MFATHPNKDNIKFIVLPLVREVLETTGDIAIDFCELRAKFSSGSEAACGINFDFSFVV